MGTDLVELRGDGLGESVRRLSSGTHFFDADDDGSGELLVASGHTGEGIESASRSIRCAQRNLLRGCDPKGGSVDVSSRAGPALALVEVGRHASRAVGDALIPWPEGVRAERAALGAKVEARLGERVLDASCAAHPTTSRPASLASTWACAARAALGEVLVRWPGARRIAPAEGERSAF